MYHIKRRSAMRFSFRAKLVRHGKTRLVVMAGLDPAIHAFLLQRGRRTWMPGTRLRQGFDEATSGRLAEALAKAASPGMTKNLFKPREEAVDTFSQSTRPQHRPVADHVRLPRQRDGGRHQDHHCLRGEDRDC